MPVRLWTATSSTLHRLNDCPLAGSAELTANDRVWVVSILRIVEELIAVDGATLASRSCTLSY